MVKRLLRLILALDNTSRILFGGDSSKVEQGAAKLFVQGTGVNQHSPYLAPPLFLCKGAYRRHSSLVQQSCRRVSSVKL